MRPIDNFIDQIIQGDALEVLKEIPSDSVDMVFADPPFNLGKKYNSYDDKKKEIEYLDWARKWLREIVRITKPTGSIFVHNIPKWLIHFGSILNEFAIFRHWISWDAMGAPLGKTLLPNHYGILYYVKTKNFKFYDIRIPHMRCRNCNIILKDYGGKKHLIHPFGPLASDVWTDIHRIRHKKRRDEHPCQLPEPLLERLILMATDEGDIVLDPFIGTGTTAVAAKKLGRHFIGIDIDPYYVKLSREKLSNVKESKIGNFYVSVFLDKILTIRDKDWEKLKNYFIFENIELKAPKLKKLAEMQLALFTEKQK